MIDLDPQCNTTQFWNPSDTVWPDGVPEAGENLTAPTAVATSSAQHVDFTETEILSDEPSPTNQASAMDTIVNKNAMTPLYNFLKRHFTKSSPFSTLGEMLNKEDALVKCNPEFFKDNLWLLAGSTLLSEWESQFAVALASDKPETAKLKSIGIIAFIMQHLTKTRGFDVIIIDLSPSNSALNEVAALSCDYILPPVMASLYSCGSVFGLLTTVLPGEKGWFGKHRAITEAWDRELAESDEDGIDDGFELCMLPAQPPTLLPFLVQNYRMVNSETQMHFSASQFFYTLKEYVDVVADIEDHSAAPAARVQNEKKTPPKVRMRANHGRRVILFAPAINVSIAATEALGRPFVELELEHFNEFFGLNDDGGNAPKLSKKRARTKQQRLYQEGMKDCVAANKKFHQEVKMMRERYESLAKWISELLLEKRYGVPAVYPPEDID